MIVNKNGVFIDTHVRYRTISDNLSKQEYKFLLTTTLTISAADSKIERALDPEITDAGGDDRRLCGAHEDLHERCREGKDQR